eukprot:TRINITY_DN3137_c1_g1_i1.p1 TRINITY_DN3137_c1_g1~~TRINITY_DN3137_c1_g1_i1.p1  ORF type:complete len:122 (-),score=9.06 TRINITY_DN3137_c1_g1_i1:156-521(-)
MTYLVCDQSSKRADHHACFGTALQAFVDYRHGFVYKRLSKSILSDQNNAGALAEKEVVHGAAASAVRVCKPLHSQSPSTFMDSDSLLLWFRGGFVGILDHTPPSRYSVASVRPPHSGDASG